MLNLQTRTEEDVVVIDVDGRIDGSGGPALVQEAVKDALDSGAKKILLNLDAVQWINSIGVGYLVAAFVSVRNQGGTLKILGSHSRVVTLLRTTGLVPTVVELFDDEAEAIPSFR